MDSPTNNIIDIFRLRQAMLRVKEEMQSIHLSARLDENGTLIFENIDFHSQDVFAVDCDGYLAVDCDGYLAVSEG